MTIYVGMDGSEGAAAAARWAVAEGKLRSTAVVAAVAWDLFSQKSLTPDGEFDPHYDVNDALAVLDSWVVAALGEEAAARASRSSTCRGALWSRCPKVPTCSWSAHAEAVASSASGSGRSARSACNTPRVLSR